jgi:hypothetical protein
VRDAVAIASKSHRYLLSTASSVATRYRNINVIALIGAEVCCRTSHVDARRRKIRTRHRLTGRSFALRFRAITVSIIFASEFFAQAAGFFAAIGLRTFDCVDPRDEACLILPLCCGREPHGRAHSTCNVHST